MARSRVLRETAYAKLNLALHVRERMPDGFHRIETLFAFCEHGDALEVEPADAMTLSIDGPFARELLADESNLVPRAARALAKAFGVAPGARLRLTKNLPLASGIGGGSADAGAALRLLARLWELPADNARLAEIAAKLGADVPACLTSRTAIGLGRGDRLEQIRAPDLAGTPVLLVNPRVPLATSSVFAGWDGQDRGGLDEGDALAIARAGRNDLEAPATALFPVIEDVLHLLANQPDALLARMSGSGASCFALFDSVEARDAADAVVGATHPGWWRLATALR